MAKRSLKASLKGIEIAKLAFERKGLTQNDLAIEVGLSTRQSIWKFFSRKPIERSFFREICFFLNLDWQDIAELSDKSEVFLDNLTIQNNADTADFIPDYKTQLAEVVKAQCSFLQSFEIRQPLLLEKIYVDTYVYYNITNREWIEINSIEQNKSSLNNLNLNPHSVQTIPALEAVKKFSKLVILGKPGAGKSTLLQYVALQCQNNRIFPELISIFIRANLLIREENYQEKSDLVDFIYQQWKNVIIEKEKVESLLKVGKILLLIDGLDEIDKNHQNQLLSNLKRFLLAYNTTKIIINSRIADDILLLEGFYYVEIADFKSEQIKSFAQKWFKETNPESTLVGEMKAEQFIQTLELPKNKSIKELAVTPIFLNLLCSIFQSSNNFPKKREQVYQVGLDILLRQWDEARGIHRTKIYENLSLVDKIKLLTDIAYINFLQNNYFFSKLEVVQIISEYLKNNNLTINLDRENLEHLSETILHSIENQHGLILQRAKDIYSFSHLVFQEYLVARKIVNTFPNDLQKQYLSELAKYIFEPKWCEVIILVTSMLSDSRLFLHLMKNELDSILFDNSRLQAFLQCLEDKVNLVKEKYKKSALRAFYFSLFLDRDLSLTIFLDVNLAGNLPEILAIDLAFSRLITISTEITKQFSLQSMLNLISYLNLENKYNFEPDFREDWLHHKQKLPEASCGQKKLEDWWKNSGRDWVETLEQLVGKYRYFETYWKFTPSEQKILKQYYQGNLFFLECLKYHANISEAQKSELEMSLLLPLSILPK